MRIAMFTNTYLPHVGGVARSVEAFTQAYRDRGHDVVVVAPEFEGMPEGEQDVIRIPAIQNFNGSDFSVVLAAPGSLTDRLQDFAPQIVHAHHPFLLGNVAARVARTDERPLVLTHHTLYEQYTHYVPANSSLLRRFVIEMATCFANMCDQVFAPSESVAGLLEARGVEVPIAVVPTGVDFDLFSSGDGRRFRQEHGVPGDAFMVGHVGRLAPEKNLGFLAAAAARFLQERDDAWFLLVGKGPSRDDFVGLFESRSLAGRLVTVGQLDHEALRHAYAAMDVFAFASRSETQGMVLTEAMAAGAPVVALEASGVREVVADGRNGRLIERQDEEAFLSGLRWLAECDADGRAAVREAARATGRAYSMERCADRALSVYRQLLAEHGWREKNADRWTRIVNMIAAEWEIFSGSAQALGAAAVDQLAEGDLKPEGEGDAR
jgi:glycosyltransferase involved in cell wall biosynthesis